jgi:hypothetical protein
MPQQAELQRIGMQHKASDHDGAYLPIRSPRAVDRDIARGFKLSVSQLLRGL